MGRPVRPLHEQSKTLQILHDMEITQVWDLAHQITLGIQQDKCLTFTVSWLILSINTSLSYETHSAWTVCWKWHQSLQIRFFCFQLMLQHFTCPLTWMMERLASSADVTVQAPKWFMTTHTSISLQLQQKYLDLAWFVLNNNYVACDGLEGAFLQKIETAVGTSFLVTFATIFMPWNTNNW